MLRFQVNVLTKSNLCLTNSILKTPKIELTQLKPPKKQLYTSNETETFKKASTDQTWNLNKFMLTVFGVTFTGFGSLILYKCGAPEYDPNGNPIKDDLYQKPVFLQYILRTYRELMLFKKLIELPSRDKLLPDPLDYPYVQPKYTLVLELTDVLVHPDWTYNTGKSGNVVEVYPPGEKLGWRFKKRPFLDHFLKSLKDSYEIVIYTSEHGVTVFPLVDAIDPEKVIAYKLVRDATYFTGGYHVKSLDNLNRDLTKVICVDWNPNSVNLNSNNLLKVRRWVGNDDDNSLIDLAMLLKTIADNGIEDVREVLAYYSQYEDPVAEFKEKQKRLIDHMEAFEAEKRQKKKKIG